MATSSPTTIPEAPYTDAPYRLNDSWCIGDSIDVINANTEYFENNKVSKTGDTMSGALTVKSDINIEGGKLDLNCGPLSNFTVNVKTVQISTLTPGQKYTLSHEDCGKVLVVEAQGGVNCDITVPDDLSVGFNVLIVKNGSSNYRIVADDPTSGTMIRNVNGYIGITKRWGICNLVVIAPKVALISGDLN